MNLKAYIRVADQRRAGTQGPHRLPPSPNFSSQNITCSASRQRHFTSSATLFVGHAKSSLQRLKPQDKTQSFPCTFTNFLLVMQLPISCSQNQAGAFRTLTHVAHSAIHTSQLEVFPQKQHSRRGSFFHPISSSWSNARSQHTRSHP